MKKEIKLSIEEIQSVTNIQKDLLESIAKNTYQYKNEKVFEIFAISIGITTSNIMGSFGIKNIDYFLDDLMIMVKNFHADIQKNARYMEFHKGIKINEGHLN